MPSGIGTLSLPLGPSTSSSLPMVILTPFGRGIIFLPTRDIVYLAPFHCLPQLTENLSANAFLARRAARHHAARRGQNIDAEPAQHLGNFLAADIHAAPRPRDALDPRNHRHVARSVFQIDADAAFGALFSQLEVDDEALFLQDARDLHFEFGGRHIHFGMARRLRVANARQHVGDGIGYGHVSSPGLLSLPARFDYAGNLARQSELAKTDPAQVEFTNVAARTPATETAVAQANLHPGRDVLVGRDPGSGLVFFSNLRCSRHVFLYSLYPCIPVFLEFLEF